MARCLTPYCGGHGETKGGTRCASCYTNFWRFRKMDPETLDQTERRAKLRLERITVARYQLQNPTKTGDPF